MPKKIAAAAIDVDKMTCSRESLLKSYRPRKSQPPNLYTIPEFYQNLIKIKWLPEEQYIYLTETERKVLENIPYIITSIKIGKLTFVDFKAAQIDDFQNIQDYFKIKIFREIIDNDSMPLAWLLYFSNVFKIYNTSRYFKLKSDFFEEEEYPHPKCIEDICGIIFISRDDYQLFRYFGSLDFMSDLLENFYADILQGEDGLTPKQRLASLLRNFKVKKSILRGEFTVNDIAKVLSIIDYCPSLEEIKQFKEIDYNPSEASPRSSDLDEVEPVILTEVSKQILPPASLVRKPIVRSLTMLDSVASTADTKSANSRGIDADSENSDSGSSKLTC